MPKRGNDADSRIFFDELVSLTASRLKAAGAIRLEDRQILIPFGGRTKLIGVAHTVFKNDCVRQALQMAVTAWLVQAAWRRWVFLCSLRSFMLR